MHASLGDVLSDLVQNGIEAGASCLQVDFESDYREIRFSVEDDGRGMDAEALQRADDPFHSDGIKHPGRRVGLGIPFLRQTAQQTGGSVDIESVPGKGTRVEAVFNASHLDLPPVGSLVLLWVQCLSFDGDYQMVIHRAGMNADGERDEYRIDRAELSETLGGLEDINALGLLREYVNSLEEPFSDRR
jgi:anti-sigma regulatory factor (Ser/Thr protein kinase)